MVEGDVKDSANNVIMHIGIGCQFFPPCKCVEKLQYYTTLLEYVL